MTLSLPAVPFSFHFPTVDRSAESLANAGFLGSLTAEETAALQEIPGNTAKAHGRPFASWLFFRFPEEVQGPARRIRLSRFIGGCHARGWHTSLHQQLCEWQDYKVESVAHYAGGPLPDDHPRATHPFGSVLLTVDSLALLREPSSDLFTRSDSAFALGMGGHLRINGDRNPDGSDPWLGHGYEEPFHVGLMLARNTRAGCNQLVEEALQLAAFLDLDLAVREDGFDWTPGGVMTEPFGFKDGISNPLFLQADIAAMRARGAPAWDPTGNWEQLIYFEPPRTDGRRSGLEGGSYVVFRKLEQNVAAFQNWAAAAGAPAAHGLVGRHPDGQPLGRPGVHDQNDFDYSDDPHGKRCPFHAHVRKANPRGESAGIGSASVDQERRRQFVRRGKVYAPRDTLPAAPGSAARVGLLFAGYMGSIEKQFSHMQLEWIERPDFPDPARPGVDLLLAAHRPGHPRFVTPRGGAYLYSPPLSWVRRHRP